MDRSGEQLSFLDGPPPHGVHSPAMRGFVPTPDAIVDQMVAKLFDERPPGPGATVLDPGCGPGAFEDGILRWCATHHAPVPEIIGIELDPGRRSEAAAKFRGQPSIRIVGEDFLAPSRRRFDYVIGNPPYVSIMHFDEKEKAALRAAYTTARGRFDLYLLFFEQALRLLSPGGRLVFITPEKFLYVKSAEPLRRILSGLLVREVRMEAEDAFGGRTTYPTITTVEKSPSTGRTVAILRDGTSRILRFPEDGSSLLPLLNGSSNTHSGPTLADACLRVSCGVATGADPVFVRKTAALPPDLRKFAHPTVSGRQLVPGSEHIATADSMLLPYDLDGELLPPEKLGALGDDLEKHRRQLGARTCTRRKPWYAFHDSVPLREILRPKLLCKDIGASPEFWIDRAGTLVPRHSAYYIVPRDPSNLDALADHLNSPDTRAWLRANCQRAAGGFLRLQSATLKRLPLPPHLASGKVVSVRRRQGAPPRHSALVLSG